MEPTTQPVPSPLRLDRYFLKKLHFGLKEGFDYGRVPDEKLTVPRLQVNVVSADQNPDNSRQWRFELNLELLEPDDGEFPYNVETTVVGYFTVNEELPTDRAERLARVNAPAVLYSSAREIVAAVTGRSPYHALLIPTVTFIQPERATVQTEVKALPAKLGEERNTTTKKASKKRASKKKSR